MAITGNMVLGGQGGNSPISPEYRQLKNERKRVEGYIRQYQSNPNSWSTPMIASLEKLALQYQVPFQRIVPEATTGQKALAFAGGVADAIALDFMPDEWYSDESTRTAANWGKGIGTAGTIAATLGAGAALRGAKALGSKAATAVAGKQAARKAAQTKPGTNFVTQVDDVQPGSNFVMSANGQWKRKIDGPGPDTKVVGQTGATGPGPNTVRTPSSSRTGRAFDEMDPESINQMAQNLGGAAEATGRAAGITAPGALANFSSRSISKGLRDIGQNRGWTFSQNQMKKDLTEAITQGNPGSISDIIGSSKLTADQIKDLTKVIKDTHGSGRYGKTLIAQLKANGSSIGTDAAKIEKFIKNIGNHRVASKDNIKKIANKANMTSDEAKKLADMLVDDNAFTSFDEISSFLITSTKNPKFDPMSLLNTDLGLGVGAGLAATRPITGFGFGEGLRPSREELESAEDPYDPYNT